MSMMLRPYQIDACERASDLLTRVRGVCMVAPTGAGKTEMMKEMARRCSGVSLVLTHTKDLVEQTARRLEAGVLAAGHPYRKGLSRYVASIQTLVERDLFPDADLILVDETHHFVAEQWGAFFAKYPFTPRIGFTATPERADGRPLGDLFDELVVAAHYSELTDLGYLVPVRLLRPHNELDRGIAMDPVEAYLSRGEGRAAFIYCRSVKLAYEVAEALTMRGVPSACIEADTPPEDRKRLLAEFAAGKLQVLTNMMALTEGVDVPRASCCIIARSIGHVSLYLQSCGRVMRPFPGKSDCLIIDLPGVSHRFGPPNENRIYSLDGEPIGRDPEASLRVCQHCGFTFVPGASGTCPRCGKHNVVREQKKQRVFNAPLQELFSGPGTPEWVKRAERERLLDIARTKGYSDGWVAQQFKLRFSEYPETWQPAENRQRAEYRRLVELAKTKGYDLGWAAHRYKLIYRQWPPKTWASEARLRNGTLE